MMLTLFKSKIHRATVTGASLHYEGSITIDPALLAAANLLPHEQVDVLNITTGARFTTYIIKGDVAGAGDIIVNGAAARLVQPGDMVIVCAYALMSPEEAATHHPTVVQVDRRNQVTHG